MTKIPNRPKETSLMSNYSRSDLAFVRGKGVTLFDKTGKMFLDFGSGIAVNSLGHSHPKLVKVLANQGSKLWHTSNLYEIGAQTQCAEMLVKHSCMDQVFFCNSGTEANEGSLKLARIASEKLSGQSKPVFVAMHQSFHGRTLGSLSVTGQSAYQEPFQPLLPEVRFANFGDLDSLRAVISEDCAGVILEPLQA